MKRDISSFVMLGTVVIAILLLIYLATHSEYVSHAEFTASILATFSMMFSGFWSIWSKINKVSTTSAKTHSDVEHIKQILTKKK